MAEERRNLDLSANFNSFLENQQSLEGDLDNGSDEIETPLPLTVTSRLLYLLGDITAGPAYSFTQWVELVRKRSGKFRSSGFPNRPPGLHSVHSGLVKPDFEDWDDRAYDLFRQTLKISAGELVDDSDSPQLPEQSTETSLWERLGKASVLDVESTTFCWDILSSLHHTEHSSGSELPEEESSKALEVTVNSGGVVFFALFNTLGNDSVLPMEATAVIKISSSRMATQSERLGYEIAKWLGVRTPLARVIHSSSPEWLHIKEATERVQVLACSQGDEAGEMTSSELLEALELSKCLLLMSYVHGSPLLESTSAFESTKTTAKIAAALGRVLMLDLIIRNEDRLPCSPLRWRGNSANLLLAYKMVHESVDPLEEAINSEVKKYKPRVIKAFEKERRAISIDSRLSFSDSGCLSNASHLSDLAEKTQTSNGSMLSDFHIVAIDSGVPRRPPSGKRANDQAIYPKFVELLLNSFEYSSDVLHDIAGGKLGFPSPEDSPTDRDSWPVEITSDVHEFRCGFRAALRDMQGFHIFFLTLHQKLENSLRAFDVIMNKLSAESDKQDLGVSESSSQSTGGAYSRSSDGKEKISNDNHTDCCDSEIQRSAPRSLSSGKKENSDSSPPLSRDNWPRKSYKGSGDDIRNFRLTGKLRDIQKFAKVDAELSKEMEQWNEILKNDVVKLCQDNNFNTGFFEGSDNNMVVDAYELKLRLEHILERIALISEAANTERPSLITSSLFIGGALAARSIYTLQHLGISHILCLCANEFGHVDSQFPDMFQYKNFSICDSEDSNIRAIFDETSDFIDHVEQIGGKVLVHCFEGKSRSSTVVLAYLMVKKNLSLSEAWDGLKRIHRRAQPNDGFARILLELDKKLHGKVSMEWQQRKPTMKVCPICGKNVGLSSSSLKLHVQKSHKKLSSGSVDSAMTMEIQKALAALQISRGGSVSPTPRQSNLVFE